MEISIIDTYLTPTKELNHNNRPLFIIIYESGFLDTKSIYDLDKYDKENNKAEFSGHFYVTKKGLIYKGRNITDVPEFGFDEKTKMNFNINAIGICIEGNFNTDIISSSQKNSIVNLLKYLKETYNSIKFIYCLDQLIFGIDNPGILFPFNEILSLVDNTIIKKEISSSNGNIKYAFGSRDLFYEPNNLIEGNDVEILQLLLNKIGYFCNISSKFDSNTFEVVKNFQNSYHLESNGIVNEDFYNILNKLTEQYIEIKDIFNRIIYLTSPTLMVGKDISRLQEKLNLFGYNCSTSGFFDQSTEKAVKDFQRNHSLMVDGKVGPITWNKIVLDEEAFITRVLKYSIPLMYGDDIKLIQQRLIDLGYKFSVNLGWYDEITANIISSFQKSNNINPTGVVDALTVKALFN